MPKPSNPKSAGKNQKPPRRPPPPTTTLGSISGGAMVFGENNGIVINGAAPEAFDKRFSAIIDRMTERILSNLEDDYTPKGGGTP